MKKMMSVEEKLKLEQEALNPDFLSISGSRLYGTDVPDSDYDYRGFTLPSFEYLVGIKEFKAVELEGDHKVYSLKRWFQLILEGDPQSTELMFASKHHVSVITEVGHRALGVGLKHALSNKSFSRIMGYSNGEWRKAMAIKVVPEKPKKGEKELLNDLWNLFHTLTREQKELIINTLNEGRPQKIVSSMAGLGSKRKAQVEKYGYCTKSAAHSIRLLNQVKELMLTGGLTFPRPNADLLRRIRNGELDKAQIEDIYLNSRTEAEKAREKSILPDEPNYEAIWEEYTELVKESIVGHLK